MCGWECRRHNGPLVAMGVAEGLFEAGERLLDMLTGTSRKEEHLFAVCPCILQIWQ